MGEKRRTKLLYGALLNLAWRVCDTVPDRACLPVPAASQMAWELAGHMVCNGFCEAGEILWKLACREFESCLHARHVTGRNDIA